MKTTKYRRFTIDEVVRYAIRVQQRMRKEGIQLRWTLTWDEIPAKKGRPPKATGKKR